MEIGIAYYIPLKFFRFVKLMKKCLLLKKILSKPTDALVNLTNQLNNFTDDEKENELNLPNCKYRDKTISKILPKILKGRPYLFSI